MTLLALSHHLAFASGLAILSAIVVRLMVSARVMDTPDARKAHDRPIPKAGGVGIVVAFLVGVAVLYGFARFSRIAEPYFLGVIGASVLIAVVALLDDLWNWPFTVKLGAQLLAALAAVGSGLYVQDYRVPYVGGFYVGWVGAPATLAWILFVTNAMNFIDGLNGLASGVALIAAAFLAGIAAWQGSWFAYFAALLLVAGLTGFLPFNFPRARIFMGDVGSQFCGFVLAMLGVVAARFDGVDLSLLLVPMLLSGVLYDVAFTLVRRAMAGERLTVPHRGHLYQVAQRAGVPAVAVALIHWGFAVWGGICCLVFIAAPSEWKPYVPLLTLVPQLAWWRFVRGRAVRAGVGRW
ncbi:MAG: undecaprenyl/decaprenyl-phosphate alpha-N-acetylglucosaminyl 1-phosphate transferase [Rhodospirillales bacterium]|jgi:UDP-GlcNAc:undecaprenyl-phosphate GlcNAc-1-phosphate transferase|nr:undecaprenyl/decaprenyl-phosphate alpha-N-acetylglucosaminyl 1-phosphate transferase [Rhodospirillales bacterium]